mmetsp:Transcript_15755/g.19208  ORF Transcript_15755/g.19208 Transcript_15755/m.19208 type:complete len:81 (+) Transcript_15755:44-286(+)
MSSNNNKSPDSQPMINWKLPDGIEDTIESGILKVAAGGLVGAVLGLGLFKSGKGWRSAGIAMGVGVAIGSTAERALKAKH